MLDTVVTRLSPWSVQDTVARFSAVIAAHRAELFGVIDHSGEAAAVGLQLRETKLVIFGSPDAETAVIDAAPLAALDLPLKVLVWGDGHQTKVSYTTPAALACRYGLSGALAGRLAAVETFVETVIDR